MSTGYNSGLKASLWRSKAGQRYHPSRLQTPSSSLCCIHRNHKKATANAVPVRPSTVLFALSSSRPVEGATPRRPASLLFRASSQGARTWSKRPRKELGRGLLPRPKQRQPEPLYCLSITVFAPTQHKHRATTINLGGGRCTTVSPTANSKKQSVVLLACAAPQLSPARTQKQAKQKNLTFFFGLLVVNQVHGRRGVVVGSFGGEESVVVVVDYRAENAAIKCQVLLRGCVASTVV